MASGHSILLIMLSLDFSRSHEEMSLKMIDHIVDEHNIEIDSESLKKTKVISFLNSHSFYFYFFTSFHLD